jgi:predicted DNA-binding transcriptional regulator YafY
MGEIDKLERIANLILLLKSAKRPLSLREITQSVEGYPNYFENKKLCRKVFERDKEILLTEGIPVKTEPIDTEDQFGYRISADEEHIFEINLDPLELALLGAARGLSKLEEEPDINSLLSYFTADDSAALSFIVREEYQKHLGIITGSLQNKMYIRFIYSDKERIVLPKEVFYKNGKWYFRGLESSSQILKTYRLDRIKGEINREVSLTFKNFDYEDLGVEHMEATVLFDTSYLSEVLSNPDVKSYEVNDGMCTAKVEISFEEEFIGWVLGFKEHIKVLSPEWLQQRICSHLRAIIDG